MTNPYLLHLVHSAAPLTVDLQPESDVMATYRKRRTLRQRQSPRTYHMARILGHAGGRTPTGLPRVYHSGMVRALAPSSITRTRRTYSLPVDLNDDEVISNQDILSYELPKPDFTNEIRHSLNRIHEGMNEHRSLINRYAAVELSPPPHPAVVVDRKYQELVDRMPQLSQPTREKRIFNNSIYEYPFTVRSDPAKNSRMRIQRILSRCRALQ